jgi:hypothetical protein
MRRISRVRSKPSRRYTDSPKSDACRVMTATPRDRAHRIAARTIRPAWPFPLWSGSVNIDRRYAAVVPRRPGRGWTGMSQTQPLATGTPATSMMNPAKWPDRMRTRAQRR